MSFEILDNTGSRAYDEQVAAHPIWVGRFH